MIATYVAYGLIVSVIAGAVVAIVVILQPDDGPQSINASAAVRFAEFGVVESIEQDGQTLTVRFKDSFDTEDAMGTGDHVFESTLAEGDDIRTMLEQAGVRIGGDGGVEVTAR